MSRKKISALPHVYRERIEGNDMTEFDQVARHPFVNAPNRTFFSLSIPVLFSLIAEPITGLVDTAFISRLGAEPMAALGVGTAALTSIFWVFNFLGVGSQTEVGQAFGRKEKSRAKEVGSLALVMGLMFGGLLILVGWWFISSVASAMGAENNMHDLAVQYMRIRILGAPAVLITIAAFGILRGFQEMRIPLWIAVVINLLNIVLDAILIFGMGPIPAMGIPGAAIASIISQWTGALLAVWMVICRLGITRHLQFSDAQRLFQIGGDMFIRTGLLLLYLLLATRAATRIGADAGAAHQAIRQVWTLAAMLLDAFAVTAQSLIAYFIGLRIIAQAKKVATVACIWSVYTGLALSIMMVTGENWVIQLLVPETAVTVFVAAWLVSAVAQPVNSLAFATDGIHWGTGDYGYLRNAMILATAAGAVGLAILDLTAIDALSRVWWVTSLWIFVRGLLGMLRIWPGIGRSPLRSRL